MAFQSTRHIHFIFVTIALVFVGCGGTGGSSKSASGSGDATANSAGTALTIIVADDGTYDDYRPLKKATHKAIDEKSFAYDIVLSSLDSKGRRCESTLRVKANDKTKYEEATTTWDSAQGELAQFTFKLSEFGLQTMSQLTDPEAALKLKCRVLGELE